MSGLEMWYTQHWNNTIEQILFLNQSFKGISP